jgi:hypothetical protein
MKKYYIICGFSGIGKSTAEQKNRRIIDFESSIYSHNFNCELGIMGAKNINFPRNYIDGLIELIEKDVATYYLLSCHKEVRDELKARGLDYIIVMPTKDQKNEYLKRWLKRGSSDSFITMMNDRWDEMIKSCEEDNAPKIYLDKGEFLSDLICL